MNRNYKYINTPNCFSHLISLTPPYIYIYIYMQYRHSTALSSYVWELKENKGVDPIMKWEVIKKSRKYRAGNRACRLCMEEKLAIASCKSRNMLNKRSEVLNSCRHKRVWLLYN